MTESIADLTERALPAWHRAADAVAEDSERLIAGLCERWCFNASTASPDGMPAMPGISDEYGWSVALEIYLATFEDAHPWCDALFNAFREANSRLHDGGRHDVWLADILALRRMPHPLHALPPVRRSEADIRVATFILECIAFFSPLIPAPDEESYAFFDRIYAMLTNVLVSEVVEVGRPGWVEAQFQSGRRLLPPTARSVFRNLAVARSMVWIWPSAFSRSYDAMSEAWAGRIADLVDALTLINPQLETLGDQIPRSERPAPEVVEVFKVEMARYFDDSFSRLLSADPRETERNANLLSALYALGATKSLFVDRLSIQASLWGGQRNDPLDTRPSAPLGEVVFGDDGSLSIDPVVEATLPAWCRV